MTTAIAIGHRDRDAAYYAKKPGGPLSHSMLQVLRESVIEFHDTFVSSDPKFPAKTPSEDMRVGTAANDALLLPSFWGDWYAIWPRERRGKAWEEFRDANEDKKDILNAKEYERVRGIVSGVLANPDARALVEANGVIEQPVYWQHASGQKLACKRDKRIGSLKIDLKTTSDISPAAWGRKIEDLGYHRQAAMYVDAPYEDGGEARIGHADDWLWIVCQNRVPFECAVYRIDPADLEQGRRDNDEAIAEFLRRWESGDWTSRHHTSEPRVVSRPRWAQA